MTRRRLTQLVIALIAVTLVAVPVLILTQPLRRRLPFRVPRATVPAASAAAVRLAVLPQQQWTERIMELEDRNQWSQLDDELQELKVQQPTVFAEYELAYLQGRVRQQLEQFAASASIFREYTATKHPYRDLALYHLAEISTDGDQTAEASRYRQQLIFDHPRSMYWSQAVEEQLAWLAATGDLDRFSEFAGRLRVKAETALRRLMDAYVVELLAGGAPAEAKERGMRLLRADSADDAAERVFRALNRPEVVQGATAEERMLLGEAARLHRHFDRAVALLSSARTGLPSRKDDLTFSIGRAFFGNEKYEDAERTYLQGAAGTKDGEGKATFFYHASRCAQLLGDDARAETWMTRAIAVPGRFTATSAALTQRMRTRAHTRRFAAAASDLRLLRQLFPDRPAVAEASLSLATSWIAVERFADARSNLSSIPNRALQPFDRPEIAYWNGRAMEKTDAALAVRSYLQVLRADVPTHFAHFARRRLATVFQSQAAAEAQRIRAEVQSAIQQNDWNRARRLQTDLVLLTPDNAAELEILRGICRRIPEYDAVLNLSPRPFPSFPLEPYASRADQLLAMGLFDEVVDEIGDRYPLQPGESALTAAYAYHLAGASRESLRAMEILARNIPEDFLPELLPRLVSELLYPRYFYQFILEDSETYDVDPVLVLAIMREESRFNPRAKSVAAARGLLQFILNTALQIGRDLGITDLSSEDLYDPRIVIQLGAKYIGDLLKQFDGNPYRTAAAYNAGPNQSRLWKRLSPAPGDDFYMSAINFDETRHYVRKVMNSFHRYKEIYEKGGAAGGVRPEP